MDRFDFIREAVNVVNSGGDSDPCQYGTYCLRCCISLAADKDPDDCIEDAFEDLFRLEMGIPGLVSEHANEIMEAVKLILAQGDDGIIHTRESALAMLEKTITAFPLDTHLARS